MPELTIIVPVYNEERTIVSVMEALAASWPEAQVIYVDDGSRDRSLALLREHARTQDTVLTKPNGGKGSAIRFALGKAEGSFTTIQDADLEYDPRELRILLDQARAHPGHVVFGSRFMQENPNIYKRYLWGNKAITLAMNLLFGGRLTDTYTCFKLFPTPLLRSLPLSARGFELEAELTCYPLKMNIPVDEVPISYRPRSLEEGKKIRFGDAWRGFVTALKIRFGSMQHPVASPAI